MIIVSILSITVSILYFWRMPDNPATARFLNEQEKIDVVKRIRVNQNGIEAKVWKRYQYVFVDISIFTQILTLLADS